MKNSTSTLLVGAAVVACSWQAAGAEWTSHFPEKACLLSLAVVPDGSRAVLVSGQGGIYRSTDAGGSWTRTLASGSPIFLATSAPAGHAVFAGGTERLHRSTDGGSSWEVVYSAVPNRLEPSFPKVALDPTDPLTLYAAGSGPAVWASSDGGRSWEYRRGPVGDAVGALVVDPFDSRVLYAGTPNTYESAGSVWRSTDAGATFRNIGLTSGIAGSTVTEIVLDPGARGHLFAATLSRGVFKSTDGGETWEPRSGGLTLHRGGGTSGYVDSLILDPRRPGRLYAGTQAGVYSTDDEGKSWAPLGSGFPSAIVYALALDPTASVLHAAAFCSGAFELALEPSTPAIERVEPGTGSSEGGTLVAVRGRGFQPGASVWVGGLPVSELVRFDDRTLRFRTAPHATGPADVLVSNPDGGTAVVGGGFRYLDSSRCAADDVTLCFEGGRLRVRASFTDPATGADRPAHATPQTLKTGSFWFTWDQSLEAVVRVLDARSVDGAYHLSLASLSDVGFEIVVSDLISGAERTYRSSREAPLCLVDRTTFR